MANTLTPLDLANLELSRRGLRNFLEIVKVNSAPVPRPFGEVVEPWQRQLCEEKVGAFENIAGLNPSYTGPLGFMEVLPRGHDKSSRIGRLCTWLLCFSRRRLVINVGAAAKHQARKLAEFMEIERQLNPWYAPLLEINKNEVTGPGGKLVILSADGGSNMGETPDVVIFEELTHWRDKKLYTAMASSIIKRPGAVVLFIMNAGYLSTWQYDVYMEARGFASDPKSRWSFYESPGFVAGWMGQEELRQARKLLSQSEAARLFDNVWQGSAEGRPFAPEDVHACVRDDAKPPLMVADGITLMEDLIE